MDLTLQYMSLTQRIVLYATAESDQFFAMRSGSFRRDNQTKQNLGEHFELQL